MTGEQQPAGTGVFNSFVQIQHTGSEQGYNTDAPFQFDEKNGHTHNHSILLADVPLVVGDSTNGTAEGVVYRNSCSTSTKAPTSDRTCRWTSCRSGRKRPAI